MKVNEDHRDIERNGSQLAPPAPGLLRLPNKEKTSFDNADKWA
jgi:hypothetical protein